MYSIVMVDDEPWALRDIRSIIDWESYAFDNVQCFRKVSEALPVILKEKPDVVLTDIRMANMNGIELVEYCKEISEKTLFCLVSAYADFEYAQRAICSGVFDYVVKPITREAIEKLAQRLVSQLQKNKYSEATKTIRSMAINALTYAVLPFNEADRDILSYVVDGKYRVVVSNIALDENWNTFQIYEDLFVTVLKEGEKPSGLGAFGISEYTDSIEKMANNICTAMTAYFTLKFYGCDGILCENPLYCSGKTAGTILSAFHKGNNIGAHAELANFSQQAVQKKISIVELTSFYNTILKDLLFNYKSSMYGTELKEFSTPLAMYGTMRNADTLFSSLHALLDNCAQTDLKEQMAYSTVQPVIDYVDKNYRENITLELLSKQFNVSLSHLCRCFKQETGISYMDYITEKRINYACELLARTCLNVSEVGIKSGYPDYCYFTKVFKKKKGTSPSNYRKEFSVK